MGVEEESRLPLPRGVTGLHPWQHYTGQWAVGSGQWAQQPASLRSQLQNNTTRVVISICQRLETEMTTSVPYRTVLYRIQQHHSAPLLTPRSPSATSSTSAGHHHPRSQPLPPLLFLLFPPAVQSHPALSPSPVPLLPSSLSLPSLRRAFSALFSLGYGGGVGWRCVSFEDESVSQ